MNATALKAAILAIVVQAGALAVLYGAVNNTQAAQWGTLAVALINAAFLIAHAWHHQTTTRAKTLPTAPLPPKDEWPT